MSKKDKKDDDKQMKQMLAAKQSIIEGLQGENKIFRELLVEARDAILELREDKPNDSEDYYLERLEEVQADAEVMAKCLYFVELAAEAEDYEWKDIMSDISSIQDNTNLASKEIIEEFFASGRYKS